MDEKINFIVYCIEEYKNEKGMNGKDAIDLIIFRTITKRFILLEDSILLMILTCISRKGSHLWCNGASMKKR